MKDDVREYDYVVLLASLNLLISLILRSIVVGTMGGVEGLAFTSSFGVGDGIVSYHFIRWLLFVIHVVYTGLVDSVSKFCMIQTLLTYLPLKE